MAASKLFLNYWGSRERTVVARWIAWRDGLLTPTYRALARRNVHADTATLVSFLVVLLFFVPLLVLKWYVAAWAALILHVVLDALDGPMARTSGYSSNRGALADIMNDISGMVVVVAATVYAGWVDPTVAVLYVASYLYLIVFTIALNLLGAGFRVVAKSKYWYYLALIATVHTGWGILTWLAAICTVYSIAFVLVAYIRMRNNLREEMPAFADGAADSAVDGAPTPARTGEAR